MHRTARRSAAALAALCLLTTALVACGEDAEEERPRTTHTTAVQPETPAEPSEPTVDPAVLEQIEQRGAPTPETVEGAVDELEVIDEVDGDGDEVAAGATVTAHYVGIVAESGEQFDSSWDRGEPATFPLTGVIQGWSEGLVGMKVGGRRTLVIPAEMAYGANPPPGSGIPADAPLVFTVDMVATAGN